MLPTISEAMIRENSVPESFHRGEEYERQGAVISLTRRGNELLADVQGSEFAPYRVRITFDEREVVSAGCTCLYDWGGWCKHIVAVLLTNLHRPAAAEETPPLAQALEALSAEQLRAVILGLVGNDPFLIDAVDIQIALAQAPSGMPSASPKADEPPRVEVDVQAVRRQVNASLYSLDRMRRSEAYWLVGGVVRELEQVLDPARRLVEAGDGRAALPILEAVTEEYVQGWFVLDDSEGEASEFFWDLGPLWTEAILSAELTGSEREEWVDLLTNWAEEISDYGVDYVFEPAIEAATQGWDDPALRRVLQGEIIDTDNWEDSAPDYPDELAIARLNVLERQGRFQEYLYLAEAEGQTTRYAVMLVRMDRVADAVGYGIAYLSSADETLVLAQALFEHGHTDEAIGIAEHGLTLHAPRVNLASWLRETATRLGRPEQALPAAVIGCREQPTLSGFLAVQELSGERWPNYRDELLTDLRPIARGHAHGAVDIFLHEGLFEDAVNTVDGSWDYRLIESVVEAVTTIYPEWVVQTSIKQATPIMDRGESEKYHHAARWLAHAREGYRALGRPAEWSAYLEGLIETHHRKYKLRPMLEALRW